MDRKQPDHHRDVQDLFDKIKRESVDAYDITNFTSSTRQTFVPAGKIEAYFRENSYERPKRLLRAVFGSSPPVSAKDVTDECCRVCCILTSLGKLEFIGTFFRYPNLRDDRLPFEGSAPPHFPVDTAMKNFYDRFCEEQWQFVAPELHATTSAIHFEEQFVLPFIGLDFVGGGGSSFVYKATVHPQHDKLVGKDASYQLLTHTDCEHGQRSGSSSANLNHCYAVKTYRRRNARNSYEKESDAFRRITEAGTKSAPGIVEFYGSFEYRGSFNTVLEYAEGGTLENFWEQHNQPSTGSGWIAYWESLFEIVRGVWWLHDHRLPLDDSNTSVSEQGWHQDLKPANILVVVGDRKLNYGGLSFKIADFELSHFKTIMAGDAEPTTLDRWGTRTYGAPECCAPSASTQSRHNQVKRCVDIWSLGCIFSEAAVWAVKNSAGLRAYRENRCKAVRLIQGHSPDDCFHDKKKLLSVVEEQHRSLGSEYGDEDFITGNVVYSMIGRMLKTKPSSRPTAEDLVDEGERAIETATSELSRYMGSSPTILPTRGHRTASTIIDGQSSNPLEPISSILDDGERFVASPSASMHQGDVNSMATIQTHANMSQSESPRSKGKARSTHMLHVDPHASPPLRHSRDGSLPTADNLQRLSSPVSPPSTSGDAVSHYPTHSPPPSKKKPVPHRSKEQARKWYSRKKNGNVVAELADSALMNELAGRDHVFFIDDSHTMDKHWREVRDLGHLLMYIVKEKDPDGVDLYFLSSKKRIHLNTSTQMEKAIDSQKPGGITSLNRLDEDLVAYVQKLQQYKRGYECPRPRNLYVLTDGILEYGEEKQGQTAITMMVNSVQRADLLRGQIGIQFISFGDNLEGISRLQKLDRLNQDESLGLDLVDTEPSTGNILKMLLGAINERFDDDDVTPVSTRESASFSPP